MLLPVLWGGVKKLESDGKQYGKVKVAYILKYWLNMCLSVYLSIYVSMQ